MSIKDFIKSKLFFKHLGIIIGVFLITLIIAFQLIKLYTRHGSEYVVPEITGKLVTEVEDIVQVQPFEIIVIDSIYTEGEPAGKILSQDPVPNSKAKKGRKIYVVVTSNSGEEIAMPNCTDQGIRSAVGQIISAGLKVGTIIYQAGDITNIVVGQRFEGKSIAENTKIKRGSYIDLVVELSPNNTTTRLPNILGLTEHEAEQRLWEVGLNVGRKDFEGQKNREHSRVVSIYPSTRSLTLGTTVSLVFFNDTKASFKQRLNSFKIEETETSTSTLTEEIE